MRCGGLASDIISRAGREREGVKAACRQNIRRFYDETYGCTRLKVLYCMLGNGKLAFFGNIEEHVIFNVL